MDIVKQTNNVVVSRVAARRISMNRLAAAEHPGSKKGGRVCIELTTARGYMIIIKG